VIQKPLRLSRRGYGRRASEALPWSGEASFGARALEGLGETELTPEAEGIGRGGVCVRASGGSGETELTPEAEGIVRDGVCVRASGGSGETELTPEAEGIGRDGVCVRGPGGRASRGLALSFRSQMIWGPCPGDCG